MWNETKSKIRNKKRLLRASMVRHKYDDNMSDCDTRAYDAVLHTHNGHRL